MVGYGLAFAGISAGVAIIFGTAIRPIVIAIFWSPQRFEREYGPASEPAPTLDAAYSQIERKVQSANLVRDEAVWWARCGALVGLLFGIVISPAITIATLLDQPLFGSGRPLTGGELLTVLVPMTVFVFPVVFGCGAVLAMCLCKPIVIAVFGSVEQFERKYGTVGSELPEPNDLESPRR
jgi:hypothetical protein